MKLWLFDVEIGFKFRLWLKICFGCRTMVVLMFTFWW